MLFPLDDAEAYLSGFFPDLERSGDTLGWTHINGVSELSVEQIEFSTTDGMLVQERVTLTHSTSPLETLPPDLTGQLNRLATMSALLSGTEVSRGVMVCKTGIFNTDRDAAVQIYAPLLCMEAAAVGWHAACIAAGNLGPIDAEKSSPWSGTNETPPYSQADFEAVKHTSDNLGLLGSIGDGSFTVEFPWDHGAVSQSFAYPDGRDHLRSLRKYSDDDIDQMGGKTSLLWIRTTERHGLFGNGVLATLEIPVPIDDPNLPSLVDELNRWELSGHDLPPLFGAWSIGQRAPTFTTFLPNQLCLPNLFFSIFHWARIRHYRVRQWLGPAGKTQ